MRRATLSLDLDDRWAYQKARGVEGWETAQSYFDLFIPLYLNACESAGVKSTVFVVGRDAAETSNQPLLRSLVTAGHEIGNHSYHHEPWMQFSSQEVIEKEIAEAEAAIFKATQVHPKGWRGPGFCRNQHIYDSLKKRGYEYDGSAFPTFLGPIARLFYQATAKPSAEQKEQLKALYGTWADGFGSLKPYSISTSHGALFEMPVTTMPVFRTPVHGTYLGFLSKYSVPLAKLYFSMALLLCKARRIEPSFLLHPLDFLGSDDVKGVEFFPAMDVPGERKRELMNWALRKLAQHFEVMPMGAYAATFRSGSQSDSSVKTAAEKSPAVV